MQIHYWQNLSIRENKSLRENVLLTYPAAFDRDKEMWTFVTEPGASVKKDSLTFVTFNTWFGEYYFEERYQALLKLLNNIQPDIIGLQEITCESLSLILANEWIRNNYYISDITGYTFDFYGVILLSRIPISNLKVHLLPSLMGRRMVTAELHVNEEDMIVASTHLESLRASASLRKKQLNEIFYLLHPAKHAVLMGDFNFCAYWEENATIEETPYQDMWTLLRGDDLGYTEDTDVNEMRRLLKREEKKVRFDRILLKSPVPGWRASAIRRIGTTPISPEYPLVFPSDHFGLTGVIEWIAG